MSENSETRPIDPSAAIRPSSVAPEHDAAAPEPVRTPPATYGRSGGLELDDGTLTVSELVVAKIASLAAQEVPGVHALGIGAARAVTAVRDRLPGAAAAGPSGVSVEVGKTQAAVDLDLVVEYGTPITEIARDVRRRVIAVVEQYTGLQVVEVNITVDDINLPAAQDTADRLQ